MPVLRKGEKSLPPYSGSSIKQAPLCPACLRPAYAAESYIAADRTSYHRKCLKCVECKMNIAPGQQKTHDKELFCVRCYEEIFNPKVQGFSICIRSPLMTPANEDERLQKDAMQVLPHGGVFPLKPVKVEDGLTEEEKRRQQEALRAKAAWDEATKTTDPAFGDCVKIKETVTLFSEQGSHSLC